MARRHGSVISTALALLLMSLSFSRMTTVAAQEVPVAHVHQGNCDALGIVVYELGPADAEMDMSGMSGMALSPTIAMGGIAGMEPTPTMSMGGMAGMGTTPTSGSSANPLPAATQVVSTDGS